MRIIVLIGLMMAAGTLVAGTTLYRWVDEQGRVHYSDQPQAHADKIEVAEPSTYESTAASRGQQQPATSREPAQADAASKAVFAGYDAVAITAPKSDQVLWNIGSVVSVNVSIKPALEPGHSVRVRYDGSEVADWPPTATSFQIKNVYRGTHTVSVSVVDADGNTVASGEAVTFYVKQTSIILN